MANQGNIFLNGEGDKWFERNLIDSEVSLEERIANDKIITCFEYLDIIPKNVLEIGCSSGWRLEGLRKKYKCRCSGIDPSSKAISYGNKSYPETELTISTADNLSYKNDFFDTIIMGFCLYLCERDKLFKIAFEVDRVLKNNGNLFILDFNPNFAYKNEYSHCKGIYSYKMNYKNMFTWNPVYTLAHHESFAPGDGKYNNNPDERIAIDVLRKSEEYAYPTGPYGK